MHADRYQLIGEVQEALRHPHVDGCQCDACAFIGAVREHDNPPPEDDSEVFIAR